MVCGVVRLCGKPFTQKQCTMLTDYLTVNSEFFVHILFLYNYFVLHWVVLGAMRDMVRMQQLGAVSRPTLNSTECTLSVRSALVQNSQCATYMYIR